MALEVGREEHLSYTTIMGLPLMLVLGLLVPVLIVRWPFAGGVIAMLLDGADVIIIDVVGKGLFPGLEEAYFPRYHSIDKMLDMYYLSVMFWISLSWKEKIARNTSIMLFAWRTIGVILFEITQIRFFLFLAPNLFENFFLFYAAMRTFKPEWKVKTKKRMAIALVLLYIPKFGQEWILHVQQAAPWNWLKETFFPWLPR